MIAALIACLKSLVPFDTPPEFSILIRPA
jgi:hypothetical protein